MDIAELAYKFDAKDVDKATASLQRNATASTKTATATEKLERQYAATMKQAKLFGAAVGAVGLALVAGVIKNTLEAEKVQAQLAAVLRSTGGAAGLTAVELNAMAAALQMTTTFGDEEIVSAQSMLLTFTKIGREVFPQAIESILDMSQALGVDLKSATIQVGKALNDPILGVTALGRAGVQFSEDQKKMIEALVETGHQAEAQAIILAELETQFGGSAVAARDTLGGALKSLQNAFGDLLEGDTGGDGIRGAKAAIEDLTRTLQSAEVKSAFSKMIEDATQAAGALIPLLIKLDDLAGRMRGKADVGAALQGYGESLAGVADRERSLTAMIEKLEASDASHIGFERRETAIARMRGELEKTSAILAHFAEEERKFAQAAAASPAGGGTPMADGGVDVILAGEGFGSGKGGRTASDKAAAEAARLKAEADRLAEDAVRKRDAAEADFLRTMEDLRAEMGGPLAQVQLDYTRRENELIELAKLAGLSQEELAGSLDILEEARLRDVAAIEKQIEAEKKRAQEEADRPLIDRMDGLRNTTAGFFVDLVKNGEDAIDRLQDYLLTNALNSIGQQIAEGMFGDFGTTGSGSKGSGFAAIFGSLFGGGRALGGGVRGDRMYQVGERDRPELANIGGKQYMIPGDRGNVEPMGNAPHRPAPAPRSGDLHVHIQGATSKRSLDRIAIEHGRRQRRAEREMG
jgi:hypothetical protein